MVSGTERRRGDPRRRHPIRVSIRAVDPLVEAGLRSELEGEPGIELQAETASADVVVAVGESGLLLLPCSPTTRLVFIASELRTATLWAAVERGLTVLIPRRAVTTVRLVRAVTDARHGLGDIPAEYLGRMLRGMSRLQRDVLTPRDLTLTGLSSREIDLLRHIADGLDIGQIAEALNYSERTVKNILQGLLTRLGLRNRTHAVAYAIRRGLI